VDAIGQMRKNGARINIAGAIFSYTFALGNIFSARGMAPTHEVANQMPASSTVCGTSHLLRFKQWIPFGPSTEGSWLHGVTFDLGSLIARGSGQHLQSTAYSTIVADNHARSSRSMHGSQLLHYRYPACSEFLIHERERYYLQHRQGDLLWFLC
jgi:hypothetical protein